MDQAGLKASFKLGRPAPTKAQAFTVFQVNPSAGERVAPGSEVTVTLYAASDGKTAIPEPKDAVAVPDCLTLSLDEASAKLKAAGFIVEVKSGRAATFAGQIERVYQIEPAPGTRVARGASIRLLIYSNRDEK